MKNIEAVAWIVSGSLAGWFLAPFVGLAMNWARTRRDEWDVRRREAAYRLWLCEFKTNGRRKLP